MAAAGAPPLLPYSNEEISKRKAKVEKIIEELYSTVGDSNKLSFINFAEP